MAKSQLKRCQIVKISYLQEINVVENDGDKLTTDKIEICNEIDRWFTAHHCYCQASREQATIGLCWSECFCFPFIANISNAIMSNQNAQIQTKIYEMYRTQTCSLCEISVKSSGHLKVALNVTFIPVNY